MTDKTRNIIKWVSIGGIAVCTGTFVTLANGTEAGVIEIVGAVVSTIIKEYV